VYNNKSGFEEALLNICMNALDAIGSVGTIKLTTEVRGKHVAVIVGDSGPGIANEERAKMFEPFVTSKEVGKGTGLGLYVSREIIGAMGGEISYATSSLGGAEFTIELPIRIDSDEGIE
jgi:two-component system NtrC family sensor kinase